MLDTGIYGAKVQSWKGANPRDLLRQVIEENPGADKPALLSETRARLLAEDAFDHLEAVIEYWFANNYHSLVERPAPISHSPAEKRERTAQATASVKNAVKDHILEEAQAILLDIVTLPSGKPLRESTGRECAQAGGWLSNIAAQMKPNQKVGAVMSEDRVREFWRAA